MELSTTSWMISVHAWPSWLLPALSTWWQRGQHGCVVSELLMYLFWGSQGSVIMLTISDACLYHDALKSVRVLVKLFLIRKHHCIEFSIRVLCLHCVSMVG